jgi:hypothetical protein
MNQKQPIMETPTEPTNAIIPASTTAVATTGFSQEILDGLANYIADDVFFDGPLLTQNGKTGDWWEGRNPAIPVEIGRRFALGLPDALYGFIQFRGKGEPPIQRYWPIDAFDYERCRATLPNNDPAHWQRHKKTGEPEDPMRHAFLCPAVDPDSREKFRMAINSKSGMREVKRLINGCLKHFKAAPATTAGCLPVIQIGSRSFPTDEGTSFAPVLEFIDWIRASDLLLPPEPGEYSEPPPDDVPLPLADPPAEPEPAPAPAPARRRRRKG